MPLHDYRQGRETVALGTKPITLAANFGEVSGVPTLAFVFDNNAHGTHVAGIAAGHNLFNVAGFDGVAPGAQLLGLKIANDARGGISMTGSIQHAMEYAARFAEQRNLPLVLNLSWGIGNEPGERAVMDSIVNAFVVAHPGIVFAISAGNDGPGLSTVGLPGSRSEEHTSNSSHVAISYAVFCLKKKNAYLAHRHPRRHLDLDAVLLEISNLTLPAP